MNREFKLKSAQNAYLLKHKNEDLFSLFVQLNMTMKMSSLKNNEYDFISTECISVAEPHHFYAAPAPGENLDAAPALAPTLLYSKAKIFKRTKV
jgi:hypothetical protein